MQIKVPDLSLVVLIGATSSGKSSFAKKYFKSTEIVSSDYCRSILSDDENDQTVNKEAFDLLHTIVDKRLKLGRLTVVDATNLEKSSRAELVKIAKENDCFPVAIVLNMNEKICLQRNDERIDRNIKEHVVKRHVRSVKQSLKRLKKEGFRFIYTIDTPEKIEEITITRNPAWNNLKHEKGPFDIIGDVHGCFDELMGLLTKLGYNIEIDKSSRHGYKVTPPEGRKAIFLGDITDRGPRIVESLKLVMTMVNEDIAICVPGNHEVKLLRKLSGRRVTVNNGLENTLKEFENESEEFIEDVKSFLDSLVSHYVLDDGKLVVAHAGLIERYHGRTSGRVRDFSIYGDVTGEKDEYGLPVRNDWTLDYRGKATVVYGHIPQKEAYKSNNTLGIDTGCVFGGRLTALRYPEYEFVDIKAKKVYSESKKPIFEDVIEAREDINIIDVKDVLGRKNINTRLYNNVKILEENSIAAFEVMSRFAIDPNWMVYLPPTMSPSETSKEDEYLEHPMEAFSYYFNKGIDEVICEEKHMGSRAVIVLCKDEEIAKRRFNVKDNSIGVCYTRTGRSFFKDENLERKFLDRIKNILDKSGFWDDFNTNWVVLDNELMPWSAKAQELLQKQYAPTGIAGRTALRETVDILKKADSLKEKYVIDDSKGDSENINITALLKRTEMRLEKVEKYVDSYRQYCWDVESIDDLRLAPFHILATEGEVHVNKTHLWHMKSVKKYFTGYDDIVISTNYITVRKDEEESIRAGIDWWIELTSNGGEGMVVKPKEFISFDKKRLIQPAVKCRGKEYLRIIYGPEYDFEENLNTLKKRALGKKRSLALREFSLGIEALERFVKNEPLYRVHECVFGVLALESEPVDPRL